MLIQFKSIANWTWGQISPELQVPKEKRLGIPHHLLDIRDPEEDFSAGDFYEAARQATEDIIRRGKVPVVVGGTGFYLHWYIHGKPHTPPPSKASEEKALAMMEAAWHEVEARQGCPPDPDQKWNVAVDLIAQLGDPEAAELRRQEKNNYYRIQRTLQVLLEKPGSRMSDLGVDTEQPLDYDFRCFFLNAPRLALYDRIMQRVEEMVVGGLIDEAMMLMRRGLRANQNMACRAIGYRQTLELLEAAASRGHVSDQDVVQLVLDIATASRNLVKSQCTWFRDEQLFHWVDASRPMEEVVEYIQEQICLPQHIGLLGDCGRLTKADNNLLKRYRPTLTLFADDVVIKRMVDKVQGMIDQGDLGRGIHENKED